MDTLEIELQNQYIQVLSIDPYLVWPLESTRRRTLSKVKNNPVRIMVIGYFKKKLTGL